MNRWRRWMVTVSCGLVVAAGLAGCGEFFDPDDDDDETTVAVNNDDGDNGDNDDNDATLTGWQQVGSPSTKGNINDMHFHDDGQRGWLVTDADPLEGDPGAFYTDNGGDQWEWRREDYQAYVARYDRPGDRVWLGGSDSRELWVSDDDGVNFEPAADGFEQQDWVSSVYFWDDQTGIVGSQTGDRIHRTTDGAETFEQQEFTREVVAGVNDIAVVGDDVWAVSGQAYTQDNTGGVMLHSDDRGASWEVYEFEDEEHHHDGGALQDVHAISTDEIWVAGDNRQLYYTDDGMETFHQIDGIPSGVIGFNGIDGEGDHIITGGNHDDGGVFIYETRDGGETWEMAYENTTCRGCEISGIEYVHDELAFAYGYDESLLRYYGD